MRRNPPRRSMIWQVWLGSLCPGALTRPELGSLAHGALQPGSKIDASAHNEFARQSLAFPGLHCKPFVYLCFLLFVFPPLCIFVWDKWAQGECGNPFSGLPVSCLPAESSTRGVLHQRDLKPDVSFTISNRSLRSNTRDLKQGSELRAQGSGWMW